MCSLAALTHGQGDAARGHDLPVGLPDASAGVFQIKHVHVDVPNVGHHKRLIRRCPGAAVVRPQHRRLDSDLTRTEPSNQKQIQSNLV